MTLFQRFSIRTKMSIIILAVGFPVVAAACFHLCVMYKTDYEKTEQGAVVTAQSIAYQYNTQVEGIRNLLTALSHFPEVKNKNRKACTTIFRKILLQSPSSMDIGVVDLKGNLIASGIPAHFNDGERKYFRDALRTRRFSAGEYIFSRAVGKPAINFALPVFDSAGKPIVVLYATFDLNQFNRIFAAQKLPANSVLNLTDYKGIVLHHYPDQEKVKPGISDRPNLRGHVTGLNDEGVFVDYGLDGVKRLFAFKRLRLSPDDPPYIYIRVSTPENSVLAGLNRYIVRSVVLFVLVALLALALNHFLIGRIFVFPIERMASVAGAVTNGDLSVRTGLQNSGAEIGLLAKSFDTMTAVLDKRLRERLKAEALLKASEEKLHQIFDHMSDAIFIHDIDTGAILEVNKAMCDMFGYGHDEACNLSVEDISQGEPPCGRKETLSRMRLAAEKEPQIFEWLSMHRDGHLFWTEVSIRRARIGGIDSLISLVRDITERKIAEEQIKAKEAQLRTLIDNLPFQLWAMDSDGRYFMQNTVSRECWGNHIGKKPEETSVPKDILKKWHDDNGRAFAGEVVKGEVVYAVDGENRFFYNIIAPIKTDHSLIGIMGVNIDITDRKSLESQLYQAQKMEAVGQLAGGIAHDFNNIITAIIGYSYLLINKTAWDDSIKGCAGQIMSCAERAAEVTRGLLAFSRKQIMLPQVVNLNEVVDQQQNMLRMFIGNNINLQWEPVSEELSVLVDKGKIEQVLMNLLVNAKDAMPNGGSIVISTSSMIINHQFMHKHGYGTPGRYACISVRDTGCGMDPHTIKKIFEPFFTTKEVGKGTGLGLAIVYGIVKQHNGYIDVYSEPDKATVFSIYLPLAGAKVKSGADIDGNVSSSGEIETNTYSI
jgi:two-component system cell cycle sensor histidine kinase/response regulator CckA